MLQYFRKHMQIKHKQITTHAHHLRKKSKTKAHFGHNKMAANTNNQIQNMLKLQCVELFIFSVIMSIVSHWELIMIRDVV